jgi:VWFA-related protein
MVNRLTIVVASGFLAVAALGLNAQQPTTSQAQPTFRAGINYVELPVRVTDRQGNFVRDLKQGDFKLFEDGWEQEIASFNFVDVPPPDAKKLRLESAAGSPAGRPFVLHEGDTVDGRVYLFVLDDYHLRPQYTFRVKSIVQSFIRQRMGPDDIAGVVYTSVTRGQDFTQDRRALISSLDRFMGGLDTEEPGDTQDLKSASTLQKIRSMAEQLGHIKGRHKALLYISPTLGCSVQQQARAEEDLDRVTYDTPSRRCYSNLRDSVRTATQSNVSIYSFDPTNIGNPGWISPGIDGRGGPGAAMLRARAADGNPVSVFDGMRTLAEETGGFTVTNVNNFDKALDRIVREHSSYYLIGYYSSNDKTDGKTRKNAIALNRADVQLVYRPTYTAPRN